MEFLIVMSERARASKHAADEIRSESSGASAVRSSHYQSQCHSVYLWPMARLNLLGERFVHVHPLVFRAVLDHLAAGIVVSLFDCVMISCLWRRTLVPWIVYGVSHPCKMTAHVREPRRRHGHQSFP